MSGLEKGENEKGKIVQGKVGDIVNFGAGAVKVVLAALLAPVHEVPKVLELGGGGGLVADRLELVDAERLGEDVVGPGKEFKPLRLNGELAHVAVVEVLSLPNIEKEEEEENYWEQGSMTTTKEYAPRFPEDRQLPHACTGESGGVW